MKSDSYKIDNSRRSPDTSSVVDEGLVQYIDTSERVRIILGHVQLVYDPKAEDLSVRVADKHVVDGKWQKAEGERKLGPTVLARLGVKARAFLSTAEQEI